MNDDTTDPITTVETTVARELPAGGEVTVEVRVTAPANSLHAAYALNAAAAAADTGLRATDTTHPAHRTPDQCGRTFVHARHETTRGWCAGLDGTEGDSAQPSLLDRDAEPEAVEVPVSRSGVVWAPFLPGRPFAVGRPCPDCKHNTVLGIHLLTEDGRHQHTRYVCTHWPSPAGSELGFSSSCGWQGWTIPDTEETPDA